MLKIVGVRHKRGVKKPLLDTQKIYYFICPLKDIKVGDFVILEYQMSNRSSRKNFFGVGRVDFLEVGDNTELLKKYHPSSYVIAKVSNDVDFVKRCEQATKMRRGLARKYQLMEKEEK